MGTHPIFESDFDCLTGRLRMWVEAVPGIAVMFGCFWIGRWGKVYAHDAGTHKGIFAGGGFTLPFTPSNSGTKKTPPTASLDHATSTMDQALKLSSNTTLYQLTLPLTNVLNVLVTHQQINLKCWSWEQRASNGAARAPKHASTVFWSDMQEPPVPQNFSQT